MLTSLALVASIHAIYAQPRQDLITDLPELTWNINYNMYSGFLDLENGHHLHYWFVESANNPSKDPIVLWLNGGPGCSSLDGLFYEMGPIHVNNTDNTLYPNPYAWNNNASIIFLESPICVGFSYTDDNNCVADDNTTANDNYHALLQFFYKFPIYSTNKFFVMGESYAGVYVPVTSKRIMVGNANKEANISINLQAFAVGDPVGCGGSSQSINSDIWYQYYHGWISEQHWRTMLEQCCNEPYTRNTCHFGDPPNTICAKLVSEALSTQFDGSINIYDWITDCYRHDTGTNTTNNNEYSRAINIMYNRVKNKNKYFKHAMENVFGVDEINVICINSNGAYNYLNRRDVRVAINIPSNLNDLEWNICSNTLEYNDLSIYDNINWIYEWIWKMDNNLYTMVYNGDADPGINFLVSQWFVDDFNQSIVKDYREWFVEYNNNQGQVGGWTINYEKISFVTIRGAGHMVPQYRPPEALKMFQAFINNKALD
eukprot:368246_1